MTAMPIPELYPEDLRKAVQQMHGEAWYFRKDLICDDDIWLASYPRSGSHFARFILSVRDISCAVAVSRTIFQG